VFPGVQGSLHTQIIAAKAVCLGEALRPEFKTYGKQIIDNARTLATTLKDRGVDLVSGGTDTHIVLLNLAANGLLGQAVQDALGLVDITSNKNPIPFDSNKPSQWVGLRLGLAAVTTRGLGTQEIKQLGGVIADVIAACEDSTSDHIEGAKQTVANICAQFPIYPIS
jgi:glycine hydroxymethyltransferase